MNGVTPSKQFVIILRYKVAQIQLKKKLELFNRGLLREK